MIQATRFIATTAQVLCVLLLAIMAVSWLIWLAEIPHRRECAGCQMCNPWREYSVLTAFGAIGVVVGRRSRRWAASKFQEHRVSKKEGES